MCVNPKFVSNLVNGCFDERTLQPLPAHVHGALSLTADEQRTSEVFVLSGDFYPGGTPAELCVSRLAVCCPVPLDSWGQLAAGDTIIYTEAYRFTEQERPHVSHIPVLCSHVGVVRLSDKKRELLYTASWVGNQDDELSHEYGEVYELWQVRRFIALAYAR